MTILKDITMSRILFVDNDEASLILYQEISLMMGIECECFQKPAELAADLDNLPPIAAAVIDLEMPHLNGYEVLALLRSLPQFHAIPIVVCTVYSGEIDRAVQAGFDGFIVKPINLDHFPEQLRAILNGQAIWERHSN
ncbi:MAG: response regulator [Anaerolineae bacterium]